MAEAEGEPGGDTATGLGFHSRGLGRGAGGAGADDCAGPLFSKAAMRSRKEPGFGRGGSDIVEDENERACDRTRLLLLGYAEVPTGVKILSPHMWRPGHLHLCIYWQKSNTQ